MRASTHKWAIFTFQKMDGHSSHPDAPPLQLWGHEQRTLRQARHKASGEID